MLQTGDVVQSSFGPALAVIRKRCRLSQLELALKAEVSQRHVSFLEINRAAPSREMVLRLSEALGLSLADQNTLLHAAGLSPQYCDSAWDSPGLSALRGALRYAIQRHDPFPALVIDCAWRPIELNSAAREIFKSPAAGAGIDAEKSLLLSVIEAGPQNSSAFDDWMGLVEHMASRLRLERALLPSGPHLNAIDLALAAATQATGRQPRKNPSRTSPTFTFGLRAYGHHLNLIATVASFAEPFDVGAANLRLECFYPADKPTEAALFEIAGPGHGKSPLPSTELVPCAMAPRSATRTR
jgi:transcriptional regulator with XRE-family HTH domain